MPERDIVSLTCLIDGYIRNKWVNKARSMFNKMPEKNVVSWTVMINGYVQHERFREALKLFVLMLRCGTRPNQFTFSNVLDACAGNIDAAFSIFKSMQNKNLVSWNSLIAGYARQGLGTRALQEFNRMLSNGVTPNQVTIFNVLLACRGSGLVEEGERHFNSMNHKYGIQPGLEHYACMMETYGKAGHMGKAETLIKEMLSKFDVVWNLQNLPQSFLKLKRDYRAVYSAFRKIHGETGNAATELKHLK
ncbi:pentatricopeptide repeat-containing protein At2g13600-like [Hibiscus syriacus]|uniref:pentatricopeptide repeat-containing protein At2g13600-like n=1 Tax=Hibiscus syriacus TaxID=106335 RepID=UPI0019222D01|nr:pentatricopeptide repeat-containing protein At2g13600-like [Hibiscus syriacus]